jgi:hypothetical protein
MDLLTIDSTSSFKCLQSSGTSKSLSKTGVQVYYSGVGTLKFTSPFLSTVREVRSSGLALNPGCSSTNCVQNIIPSLKAVDPAIAQHIYSK